MKDWTHFPLSPMMLQGNTCSWIHSLCGTRSFPLGFTEKWIQRSTTWEPHRRILHQIEDNFIPSIKLTKNILFWNFFDKLCCHTCSIIQEFKGKENTEQKFLFIQYLYLHPNWPPTPIAPQENSVEWDW